MSATSPSQVDLNYGLDDRPEPFARAMGLGLQHVLTMFGATVLVPLILGPAMEMGPGDIAILVSSVFICSGIATFLQLTVGSRLPIIQGVSFAFLVPFFAIIAAHPGPDAMRYIAGMVLVGALVEVTIGFGGLFGLLRKYVTPVTIAPVIALIGLSLFEAAADTSANHWGLALLMLALVFIYSLVLAPKYRFFSLFPVLLAIITSYVVALIFTWLGTFPEGSPAAVSFAALGEADWIRGITVGEGGIFFPWGLPLFDWTLLIGVLAAYLASMIESFGDYHAVSRIATGRDPDSKTIDRGIGSEGLGCFATGLLGGFASTSYSENIGLVGLTKVASRYVVILGAGALVVLGLIAKFGAVVATIPLPIVGGAYLALFGLIAAIGLSLLRRIDMDSQRNLLIVGFVLFAGFVFPHYFGGVEEFSFFGIGWLSDIIVSIGSSGIATAAVLGLLLDNLIPGTPEERGMTAGYEEITTTGDPEAPRSTGR
ncbi:MAG: uracil-xanthine permease family protein [Actinomycetota bacterium]